MKSIKLQLHVPSMIQTTGNKKSLHQGPKLTTCWKIPSRDLGKSGVIYEGNDFPMQDQVDFLPSTGTALSLPACVTWGNAGNPNTKLGCAFPAVTLQAHCSEMQVLKTCPCLTVLLLCLKAFIFSMAYGILQNSKPNCSSAPLRRRHISPPFLNSSMDTNVRQLAPKLCYLWELKTRNVNSKNYHAKKLPYKKIKCVWPTLDYFWNSLASNLSKLHIII